MSKYLFFITKGKINYTAYSCLDMYALLNCLKKNPEIFRLAMGALFN